MVYAPDSILIRAIDGQEPALIRQEMENLTINGVMWPTSLSEKPAGCSDGEWNKWIRLGEIHRQRAVLLAEAKVIAADLKKIF